MGYEEGDIKLIEVGEAQFERFYLDKPEAGFINDCHICEKKLGKTAYTNGRVKQICKVCLDKLRVRK